MRKILSVAVFICALLTCGPAVCQPAEPVVSPEEVARAIERGVAFIKSLQRETGSWPYTKAEHVQGATALAVLALSEAGVGADDPSIVKGLEYVVSRPFTETYNAACAAMAFASVNPGRYVRKLADARTFLERAQNAKGMWSYRLGDPERTSGDNSNTQFAVLGLHAAMSVGLEVSQEVLRRAEAHYTQTQNGDGGWSYRPGGNSYGSMTTAGVASLYILGSRLYVEGEICGQYRQDPRVAAGFSWLVRNFSATSHPAGGSPQYLYYYLYALERVGVLTGLKYFGTHDWYLEGARTIVDAQNADGSWMAGRDQLPTTCFAVLFLSKGNVPVLINKLAHGGEWNVDAHDAANLTSYVSGVFGQRVGWQAVSLDDSMDVLLSAPVLYVTGHKWPTLRSDQVEKLSRFFEMGGFMFAEACCGRKEFDAGFRRFARQVFPELRLQRLPRTHALYRSWFKLTGSARWLEGIQAGCRTPVVYSPRDFSCTWEKNDIRGDEEAFEFGTNIAAYVTGKERLRPKLEQQARGGEPKFIAAPAGAFTFAQAAYGGDWNPHPEAGPKLISFLNEKAGLNVAPEPATFPLTDENLAKFPFIYITGFYRFSLTDDEKKALVEYLERGGFLFADATAGRSEFDESFRALMMEILPSSPLVPLGPDSPVYRMAFDTRKVTYTAAVRELEANLDTLTLYGATVNGRLAVIYSPYDIGCALTQFPAYGSRGLVSEDAFKVAANIVLYALTY